MSVALRDFRNYAAAEAHLGPGLTIAHGPNGAGKSNLLEAIFFGCTGHALRARNDRELARFDSDTARVTVTLEHDGDRHELSVGYQTPAPGRPALKRMRVDGAIVERLLDSELRPLLGVFVPDRLELIKGPPAPRRAHLDRLVAALWPTRVATRRAFARALAQRNALLAAIRAGRAQRATLPTWDRELARHALALRDDRAAATELLSEPFARYGELLGLQGALELRYRPRSHATDVEQFVAELQERLPAELERGYGSHGPHRDELLLLRDGRELRVYGSQGEQRLCLLALLLAERAVLARERGHVPLLLLDDVMSELDAERRELLVRELRSGGQSVIATTDLGHVPAADAPEVTLLRVAHGTIHEQARAA